MALELRRYNQRHDNVLRVIVDGLQSLCPPQYQIMAGLPESTYDFPSTAASTDLRPDLVVWSDTQQVMVLAELTVCFETNYVDASQRKTNKYQDLLETCTANGYTTTLVMGSRGFANVAGFEQLLMVFPISKGGKLKLLTAICRGVLT